MRRLFPTARQPWAPAEPRHNLTPPRCTERGSRHPNCCRSPGKHGNPDILPDLTWVALGRCLWPSQLHPASVSNIPLPPPKTLIARNCNNPFLTI